ncbi:MAG: YeeE/YedE family protein [Rhodobacteraceae bacterium]|nr:YeeE/YedE family protein [Paracoccaceae bacterium]
MPAIYAPKTVPDLPKVGQPNAETQLWFVGGVLAVILAITLYVNNLLAWQQAQNFLMGCLLGYVLYRATFGFTGPWRNLIVHRRGLGTRKTLAMLAAASVTMMLLGAYGGYPNVTHAVGWSLLIGAFMFGVGMQFGGCCGSGTAYVAGGGSARVWVTLAFFIVGSVWGSIDAPAWWKVSKFGKFSMVQEYGVWPAIFLTLAALAVFAWVTVRLEKARHGELQGFNPPEASWTNRAFFGPWSPLAGGVLMGALTGFVLVATLQPWGITFGYTIYGAKIATALGIDLASINAPFTETAFWGQKWAQAAINQPLWINNAANMNIGIILGAALAAGLVGKWHPSLKGVPMMSLVAAAIGGILMGYGARISTGCNIGAMGNGIASGSLHGWAWMAAAFAGNMLGIWFRPMFKMEN